MPAERWSVIQAESVAPDAASVKAARALSGPASWSSAGRLDDILWGVCRSYQVCVDIAGPAFRCSCPSRKIPCKHALGLLMLWAGSDVSAQSPPAFATEWQAARAARAETRSKAASTPDPVAAARRAEQRAERVAGGMAELRRWLDDQVQHGLAGMQHGCHRAFETMAARLIDAQAPTAAGAVRRLGAVAGVGPHWADRLLGELAMLRLLVAGHERLDELTPGLAATVRSRIGFPVATEEVLAGPRVTDRWQVLGQVDSDDGALTTRRTWLRGAGHGRFALVLSFAAPGQTLAADLVPGTEFRGDLAFYPGSAPLRALVASRESGTEPFRSPEGAADLATALSGWATAVAAEPWRYDVPVLLAGVVPSDDGWLVDTTGAALPLAPGHREPWWLLAAGGAAPAVVAAEWSPSGLRPLAAWADGVYVPAAPPVPEPAATRAPELPPPMLAAALVGTDRRPWTGSASLLEAAAVALTARRAGVLPAAGRTGVPAAPPEFSTPLPAAAGRRLERILCGSVPGGSQLAQELLAQWLAAAAERNGHVPPSTLPALLDAGRRNSIVRPALARVAGQRGQWLAGMRGDWRWLHDEAAGADTPAAPVEGWATGTLGERLRQLRALRATDPVRGRELLESTWSSESSEGRARFIGVLEVGLSLDDDAFLDRALDDRRREVREAALELLRRLPGAALGTRMAERSRAAVQIEHLSTGAERLIVSPPEELTPELRRDGVAATPARGTGVSAWLLEEVVAGAPLSTWSDPATMVRLAQGNDWESPLLHGWGKAATTQNDAGWAATLLGQASAALRESVRWDLHLVLPPDELGRLAAEALRREDGMAHRLLALHPGRWPEELSVTVLETIAHRARTDRHSWQLGELCRSAALSMPPAYADPVERLARQLDQEPADPSRVRPVADLARALAFRRDMFAELRP